MNEIQKKLLEITEVIKEKDCTAAGLFTGNSGIAIFLAYVNQLYNSPDLNNMMEDSLHQSFEQMEKSGAIHTFADGYAGICWSMNHLVLQNKADADVGSLFEEIEPYLTRLQKIILKKKILISSMGG